ncbi:MAG: hypothetical protein K6T74_14940, partial [Geminicoccaceae bacterium]|nr:hypothetical protein [Geminicoccaceae bacterium]
MSLPIALDGMGGDAAPAMVVDGAALALRRDPELRFVLFGDESRLRPLLDRHAELRGAVELVHTPDFVAGDAKPSLALRQGRTSSMRLAIDAVKEGRAAAAVSAGNTGALMAGSLLFWGHLAGARRPALVQVVPSLDGPGTVFLDMGAHMNATWDELVEFAERAQIPVAHTLLGIGAIDERHPLSYGYMGMHGWKHVNRAIQSADLLIALGMRFDDRVTGNVRTYAPHARIVHVDIDPSEIGKNVAVEVPIVGDVKRVLRALIPLVEPVDPAARAEYFAELAEWRRESEGASWHGSGAWRDGYLSADYVVSRIGELTNHEAIYVADVGQHQMWLARYTGFREPNTHLSSGGLGTMGFSVPAAMGAALGRPDKEVWAVCGDGGFQMTM